MDYLSKIDILRLQYVLKFLQIQWGNQIPDIQLTEPFKVQSPLFRSHKIEIKNMYHRIIVCYSGAQCHGARHMNNEPFEN